MADLIIPTPPKFSFRGTILSHGWLELAPFETSRPYTSIVRTEQLSSGKVLTILIQEDSQHTLHASAPGEELSESERAELVRILRRIFNLDIDLEPFYAGLRKIERYRWVEDLGGGRLLRSATVWEDMAKTLLTTNTTWAMTCKMVERLTDLGEQGPSGKRAFPPPERIASMRLSELSDHVRAGYRNAYLHRLAVSIAEREIDPESWASPEIPSDELFKMIRAVRGFGPYAAGAMMKMLGRFDRLAIDSAARSMFARAFNNGEKGSDREIQKHYDRYGEWKGLVMWTDLMGDWFRSQYESKDSKNGA